MEVVAAPPPPTGGMPFRDRDVREWSRIDSISGALERARLETDSWSATTSQACHRYGKVVDSRARTGADGSLQAQASRQLEVFQSKAGGSRLQVVKTKTVSSSRWSGKTDESPITGFENLRLPLNPLDLTSQKSKASVGRSANRRPPSRPSRNPINPSLNDLHSQLRSAHFTAATNLHRVSRLCHQIHESAVRNAFGRKSPSTSPRGSADGSVSGVEITEIESSATSSSDVNSHSNLARTKSNSSDDVHQVPEKDSNVKSVEDLEDLEQLQSWRRNSKVRRSLQIPTAEKSPIIDLPESTVNVKKLRDELEKGRRLTTALRNNSISTDLNALDNIIQSISSASSLERSSTDDNLDEEWLAKHKQKRESFVTVESLQAVKDKLRHTSSPYAKLEDSDDGIVTEDATTENQSTVKSYVYGMEKMLNNKKSVIGTGSLESRSKLTNGNASHKNEDWYNRRKSYGFEKVHGTEESSSISLKNKNLVESSTDSGICRSSEIMIVPTATKPNTTNGNCNSDSESELENGKAPNGVHYGKVKKMTSIFNQEDKSPYANEPIKAWSRRQASDWKANEIKSTTITIPIVQNNNVVDLSWNNEPEKDANRHPLVADDKYTVNHRKNSFAATEPLLLTEDDTASNGRKSKKVEFCKTEVHFAAESGKVNIVETDEKPPPTQNFRRRRRNSGPTSDYAEDFNKSGLPVLHFGDSSYEKTMFGISDDLETDGQTKTPSAFSIVTVNTNSDYHTEYSEEERKDLLADNDNLKGILKNKPVKPKPYHLGQLDDTDNWGVKLRHVPKESPPIWKSTVTVHSNLHANPDLPEFQKLLRNLRPTTKKTDYLSDNENRYSDSFAHVRMVPPTKDNRRSSWSVADRVQLADDFQESKGYSTKVNFGDGQATVVQSDQSTWPRMENLSKDSKQILNRGLVVRIGREDSISKHTVCSKMTTTRQLNNTTTTTKITIDLSPSPPTTDKTFTFTKFKRSHHLQHSFKSTPLVLNTLKDRKEADNKIPQQLEALRKLYEDVPSDDGDSDADKEVQRLLSRVSDKELNKLESDTSSVVSGSWSRMRAFKNFAEVGRSSFKEAKSKFDLSNAKDIKDTPPMPKPPASEAAKPGATYNKYSIPPNHSKYSPVVLRKSTPFVTTEPPELIQPQERTEDCSITNNRNKEFRNLTDPKLHEHMVLRQPKQSEMTYFGVGVCANPPRETIVMKKHLQKPDLLQNHQRILPAGSRVGKPRRPTPEQDKRPSESPIYENLKPTSKPSKYSNNRDFDSSILDELTKAADQILQVVNGYTSEDCQARLSSDEEEPKKLLDTISETKSWKNSTQDLEIKNQLRMRPTLASAAKVKVKRTSSTSSVDSLSRDRRKQPLLTETRKPAAKSAPERSRKAPSSEGSSNKASTKARRLQRASSREALLQSHGSSSEDLPTNVEAPVRKPRLIKRTKATQLTMTSGLELKKPVKKSKEESEDTVKSEARILRSLPEIRHKTAVSTITSTVDKCSRDRSRTRSDESKSRSHSRRESSSKGTLSSLSTRANSAGGRGQSHQSTQRATSASKDSGVTQHRISTANIKRCHRSETSTRH